MKRAVVFMKKENNIMDANKRILELMAAGNKQKDRGEEDDKIDKD